MSCELNGFDPVNPSLPIGDCVSDGLSWLEDTFAAVFNVIEGGLTFLYEGLAQLLSLPPYWVIMLIFAVIAWLTARWPIAVFTLVGFYVIRSVDLWGHAMETISLVTVAVVFALLFAIPIGILAAKVSWVSTVARPILDFMQTMPAMVYLVPAITIFSVGIVPGAVATIIFAMPPGVRLTELAIRQVDEELVEAGKAFGATSWRILWQTQLPVALPTIMAGVNQVIMLALSMVVLAGMAGAGGLGGDVVGSLSSLNVPLGVDAGLAVVIIAIWLDRVSNGLGTLQQRRARAKASAVASEQDDATTADAPAAQPATT